MSLKIEHLVISYGGNEVVSDFNLDVEDNEFVALLGPSGSGKTSILRCLAGLLRQKSGKITINGKVVSNLHPSERNIAMVFQNYALYPHLKIFENIALNLRMKKVPRNDIEKKVKEVSKLLGIDKLLDKYPRETSGGQSQRVGLARAMVRDPGVYLMDEPLSNLDAKFRDEMRFELRRFYELSGRTVVYVTHDQLEAMSMADRVVVISEGKKMQEGKPKELYDNPENTFVAGFVGSPPMNLFDSARVNGSTNVFNAFDMESNTGFSISTDTDPGGNSVVVGFRPSDLKLDDNGEVTARLQRVEFLGPYLNLHVMMGGSEVAVRVQREGSENDHLIQARAGEPVKFTIESRDIYLFDSTTGNRIRGVKSSVISMDSTADGVVHG